jgi:hypothetical protein
MLQAIIFYSEDACDLIKEDEMSLKDHGDDSFEEVRVQIKVDPVQKKKCLPGNKLEAPELRKSNSIYFHPYTGWIKTSAYRAEAQRYPQKYY